MFRGMILIYVSMENYLVRVQPRGDIILGSYHYCDKKASGKFKSQNIIDRYYVDILGGRAKVVFQTFNWVRIIVSRETSLFEILFL